MSVQQMMKKNAIAKVSFRYGSMDALGSSFAHLLGCCNITAEVADARDLQGSRNQKVNFNLIGVGWCYCLWVFFDNLISLQSIDSYSHHLSVHRVTKPTKPKQRDNTLRRRELHMNGRNTTSSRYVHLLQHLPVACAQSHHWPDQQTTRLLAND